MNRGDVASAPLLVAIGPSSGGDGEVAVTGVNLSARVGFGGAGDIDTATAVADSAALAGPEAGFIGARPLARSSPHIITPPLHAKVMAEPTATVIWASPQVMTMVGGTARAQAAVGAAKFVAIKPMTAERTMIAKARITLPQAINSPSTCFKTQPW
jgi:hypothetical protein